MKDIAIVTLVLLTIITLGRFAQRRSPFGPTVADDDDGKADDDGNI
jgi:hypothetical protein